MVVETFASLQGSFKKRPKKLKKEPPPEAKMDPRSAPGAPKTTPRAARSGPRGPRSCPRGHKRARRAARSASRRPPEAPRAAQEAPREAKRAPREPQEAPRGLRKRFWSDFGAFLDPLGPPKILKKPKKKQCFWRFRDFAREPQKESYLKSIQKQRFLRFSRCFMKNAMRQGRSERIR